MKLTPEQRIAIESLLCGIGLGIFLAVIIGTYLIKIELIKVIW